MNSRVYVLLDVKQGKSGQVVRTLRARPGVRVADILESPPDVIAIIEASGRQELAVRALGAVEDLTDGMQLLLAAEQAGANVVGRSGGRRLRWEDLGASLSRDGKRSAVST